MIVAASFHSFHSTPNQELVDLDVFKANGPEIDPAICAGFLISARAKTAKDPDMTNPLDVEANCGD